jgi:hypothetical protein
MTDFNAEDYAEHLKQKLKGHAKRRAPELRRQVQAATAMQNLTGSSEWNGFLNLVEGMRQEALAMRDAAEQHLQAPDVVDVADLMRAKIARSSAVAVVEALDRVVAIPKQLLEEGKVAKRALDA